MKRERWTDIERERKMERGRSREADQERKMYRVMKTERCGRKIKKERREEVGDTQKERE